MIQLDSPRSNVRCACKGIRKCALCAPTLVEQEKQDEEALLSSDQKRLYLFCFKCSKAVPLNKSHRSVIDGFIRQDDNNSSFTCECHEYSECDTIKVNGIYMLTDFVTSSEEAFLLDEINKTDWVSSQSGRFKQDYGPQANFNRKKIKTAKFTGLPAYSRFLLDRFKQRNLKIFENFDPVELCNLKYDSERASCIDPHFDDWWLWGERLITLSLLSNTFYTLTPGKEIIDLVGDCEVFVPVKRQSLIVVSDEARYKWLHSIKRSHVKSTRLAITLRELSPEFKMPSEQHGSIGKSIEKLALSFKGVSTGKLEKILENTRPEIAPQNLELDEKLLNILKSHSHLDSYKIIEKRHRSLVLTTQTSCISIKRLDSQWEKDFFKRLSAEIKPDIQMFNSVYLDDCDDFSICIQNNGDTSEFEPVQLDKAVLFNIGKQIAEWREFSVKVANFLFAINCHFR